ncbi:MAG: hypothetical protein WCA46_19725 [Actinocatenispora sp.]
MGLLSRFRRRQLPAEARRPLADGEHVVAWAPHRDAGYLVATNHGLWLPDRPDQLRWHEIHKATWSGRDLVVVPGRLVGPAGSAPDAPVDVVADEEPTRYPLTDPGGLPHQVRVRVTRSVAYSTHHELPNGGVRVVARRVPGHNGLSWAVRYDPGTSLIGPDHDLVAELVAQARSTTETG